MNLPAGPGSAATSSARSFSASFVTIGAATIAIVAGALLIALPALAYQCPLWSTDIRDAYFIGARNDDRTAAFFAAYSKHLAAPESGPDVDQVSIDTPYAQVVRRSMGAANYNSVDAVEEFDGRPMNFGVTVRFYFTDTYTPAPLTRTDGISLIPLPYPDFWNDFKVRLIQDKEIRPKAVRGAPIYPMLTDVDGPPPLPIGGTIEVDYDPAKIDTADATVEVITPDGQDIQVPFALSRLK
ncbi:MAG: hypothetical protein WA197_11235 [Candidatus Acidiferrales bacterium]